MRFLLILLNKVPIERIAKWLNIKSIASIYLARQGYIALQVV